MTNQDLEKTAVIIAGKTILDTPNDAELGEKVRKILYERHVIEKLDTDN